jgi:hypothetical protein|tara:strand:- start:97 stop:255 length:159 start_codon:yes stop_codon:yes gene_type:complete
VQKNIIANKYEEELVFHSLCRYMLKKEALACMSESALLFFWLSIKNLNFSKV